MCYNKRNKEGRIGLTTLQVDDSYGFGSEDFLNDEGRERTKFKGKERQILKEGDQTEFQRVRNQSEYRKCV